MKLLQILAAVASVSAAPHGSTGLGPEFNTENEHPDFNWSYYKNGATWGIKNIKDADGKKMTNVCGDKKIPQSPIDLKNSWPKKTNLVDRFSKVYTDQTYLGKNAEKKIEVAWNGHTSQIAVDKDT
jgi:hypothetical protein